MSRPRADSGSSRSLAKAVGLGPSTVRRIWQAFALQPHRTETLELSNDPLFVERVRDIVGLYLDPPERALVPRVDEKSRIQALDRTQPIFPMTQGLTEQRTHDHERHGTTTFFAALDVRSGRVIGSLHRRHRAREFLASLKKVDAKVPAELDLHLILDNHQAHKVPAVKRWLVRNPRFHLHFTPTHSSWINLVERWFAALTDKQICRGTHRSVKRLEDAIRKHIEVNNEMPKPLVSTKTADGIPASVQRCCLRTSGARRQGTSPHPASEAALLNATEAAFHAIGNPSRLSGVRGGRGAPGVRSRRATSSRADPRAPWQVTGTDRGQAAYGPVVRRGSFGAGPLHGIGSPPRPWARG